MPRSTVLWPRNPGIPGKTSRWMVSTTATPRNAPPMKRPRASCTPRALAAYHWTAKVAKPTSAIAISASAWMGT